MDESSGSKIVEIALRDPRAPFLRRWAAWSLDLLLTAFAILAANRLVPAGLHEDSPLLGGSIALAFALLYFWVPEAIWGATPGKFAAGVRVVDASGEPPGFGRALLRTLLRFLEANPLLFGAFPAALVAYRSRTGRRVGDILAGTYVLRAADLRDRAT